MIAINSVTYHAYFGNDDSLLLLWPGGCRICIRAFSSSSLSWLSSSLFSHYFRKQSLVLILFCLSNPFSKFTKPRRNLPSSVAPHLIAPTISPSTRRYNVKSSCFTPCRPPHRRPKIRVQRSIQCSADRYRRRAVSQCFCSLFNRICL